MLNAALKMTIVILVIVTALTSCVLPIPEDKVLTSLGEYKDHEFYTQGEFQDFTDYAKYYYDSADLSGNDYFTKIKESHMPEINELLDDFELWIETYRENDATCEIVVNYDFDRAVIDNEDYAYIYSEKSEFTLDDGTTTTFYDNYDVYIFDVQTQTLYYFHNNI